MSDQTAPSVRNLTPRDNLQIVYALVDYMTNLEGQDEHLVIELSQCMINDLIEHGELVHLHNYILTYCDVLDGTTSEERTNEAKEMAEDI